MDSSSKDFDYAIDQQKQDELSVNYRFGTKFKLGYQFNQQFEIIAYLGITSPSTKKSYGTTKATLLYGFGIYYHYTLRAYYDYQSLKTHYIASQTKDDLQLSVARIGFMLNF